MTSNTFNVHETPDGWHCPETSKTYGTASGAKAAIDRQEKAKTPPYGLHAAVIVWHPTTRIGRIICKAIGAEL